MKVNVERLTKHDFFSIAVMHMMSEATDTNKFCETFNIVPGANSEVDLKLTVNGVLRFKPNAIVMWLLENGPFDLNQISVGDFSREDHEQFAQLIGYSLSGWGSLSYVSDEAYERAHANLPPDYQSRSK